MSQSHHVALYYVGQSTIPLKYLWKRDFFAEKKTFLDVQMREQKTTINCKELLLSIQNKENKRQSKRTKKRIKC